MDNVHDVICENCDWEGFTDQLVCSDEDFVSGKPTDEIPFNLCPNCGAKDIVDYED